VAAELTHEISSEARATPALGQLHAAWPSPQFNGEAGSQLSEGGRTLRMGRRLVILSAFDRLRVPVRVEPVC
jgi:hypothetical protein